MNLEQLKVVRMTEDNATDEVNGERPPTPERPVPSYYRIAPNSKFWLYYDGEKWLGEPRELAWYSRPVSWGVGRPPAGVVCAIALLMLGLTSYFIVGGR